MNFEILLYNFKCIVLSDYLELEGEISIANRSDIIFILDGHSVLSIATGFEGSRRHPHSIHMMDWFTLYESVLTLLYYEWYLGPLEHLPCSRGNIINLKILKNMNRNH